MVGTGVKRGGGVAGWQGAKVLEDRSGSMRDKADRIEPGRESNNPDLTFDEEFFWIGYLRSAECPVRLKELMHSGDDLGTIVIGDQLGTRAWLKAVLGALPIGERQIHLDFLPQFPDSSPPSVVAGIEPLSDFTYANLPNWRRIQWNAPWNLPSASD
jgi:hypothetical protein